MTQDAMILHAEHECEIPTRDEDILFLPGRGPLRKLCHYFRRSLMASRRNPAARKFLRSTTSIVREKRRQLRSHTHIIHPFSMFRYDIAVKDAAREDRTRVRQLSVNVMINRLVKVSGPLCVTVMYRMIVRHYWDFLMVFVMTTLMVFVPYHTAFEIIKQPVSWSIIKNSLLLTCWLDVAVNLMTGYLDEEEHAVILEQRKIMNRYIKRGTFFPDLVGSFPSDVFFLHMRNSYRVARKTASLVCLFRVFSMSSYIGRLAYVYDTPLAVYEFCVIIFWLLIALHWQACLYWLVPMVTVSIHEPVRPSNDSWVHTVNLWEYPTSVQYTASMLRAISTFLRSGLLRTNSRNVADIYLLVIFQLLGTFVPWVLVAHVMQFLKGTNSSRLRYQSTVAQLRQYMRHRQLPYPTQRRIIEYYEFRFQRRFFRESEIIHTLSSQMRHEISMHSCRKLVENVTFFNNLPLTLLGRIVALLRSEIFLTNDVIVRANQPGDCMYFIATGTVAIYTSSGKEVCHLEDGAHFGEIALVMPNEMRVASVVAVEVCELYRLNRADFARTIHPYPMLWERIKNIAVERHEKTMILSAQ